MAIEKQIRLFCFPYAGANINSYKVLESELPNTVILHPVELPGRGRRFNEKLVLDMDEAVDDIWTQIKSFIVPPYAILGHSMGTVLGYLITKKIISLKLPPPVHLFCLGRSGFWEEDSNYWHLLPSKEFWELIDQLGGIPESYLSYEEMKLIFEPILRADLQILETFPNKPHQPIDVPIIVMLGEEDKFTQRTSSWHLDITSEPSVYYFSGGHFFFLKNCKPIAELISKTLFSIT